MDRTGLYALSRVKQEEVSLFPHFNGTNQLVQAQRPGPFYGGHPEHSPRRHGQRVFVEGLLQQGAKLHGL